MPGAGAAAGMLRIGLGGGLGRLRVVLHFGMWRSATSGAKEREQWGHDT
jgi:hypothetical protein